MFSGWSSRRAPPIPFGCLWSGTISLQSANSGGRLHISRPARRFFGSAASASRPVNGVRDIPWGGADLRCAEHQAEICVLSAPARDRSRRAIGGLGSIHSDGVSWECSSVTCIGIRFGFSGIGLPEESGMTLCSVAATLTCSPSRYTEDELVLQRGRQSKGYLMSALQDRFAQAQEDVNALAERPDNNTMLKLYALYKQATQGDATGAGGWLRLCPGRQVRCLERDQRHLCGGCHAAVHRLACLPLALRPCRHLAYFLRCRGTASGASYTRFAALSCPFSSGSQIADADVLNPSYSIRRPESDHGSPARSLSSPKLLSELGTHMTAISKWRLAIMGASSLAAKRAAFLTTSSMSALL